METMDEEPSLDFIELPSDLDGLQDPSVRLELLDPPPHPLLSEEDDAMLCKVIQCKMSLETIPETRRNKHYQLLVNLMEDYLNEYCQHEFVDDYIDITPDYSCYVRYCEYCGTTMQPSSSKKHALSHLTPPLSPNNENKP